MLCLCSGLGLTLYMGAYRTSLLFSTVKSPTAFIEYYIRLFVSGVVSLHLSVWYPIPPHHFTQCEVWYTNSCSLVTSSPPPLPHASSTWLFTNLCSFSIQTFKAHLIKSTKSDLDFDLVVLWIYSHLKTDIYDTDPSSIHEHNILIDLGLP